MLLYQHAVTLAMPGSFGLSTFEGLGRQGKNNNNGQHNQDDSNGPGPKFTLDIEGAYAPWQKATITTESCHPRRLDPSQEPS